MFQRQNKIHPRKKNLFLAAERKCRLYSMHTRFVSKLEGVVSHNVVQTSGCRNFWNEDSPNLHWSYVPIVHIPPDKWPTSLKTATLVSYSTNIVLFSLSREYKR